MARTLARPGQAGNLLSTWYKRGVMPDALLRRVEKLTSILEVAKAMSAEHSLDSLLPLILNSAVKVVNADRCSLFILDQERQELWSRIALGAVGEIRLKVGKGIVGSVAQTGQGLNLLDAYTDARFDASFDQAQGYRTQSILAVPMRNARGEVTGVLQALNALDGHFDAEDEEFLIAFGAQAAGALDNAMLHQDIERLFEGFVAASVVAIESRDPTTSGHSSRVAALTCTLAEATQRNGHGLFAGVSFTASDLRELRYASLLHDFGKVGVREAVLVKANKLFPHELELLKARFALAERELQLASLRRLQAALIQHGPKAASRLQPEEDARLQAELSKLHQAFQFIEVCNRPTVLAQGGFEKLSELAQWTYQAPDGTAQRLLTDKDVSHLSIPKGSLSKEERLEIESHVSHTFRFLSQIPWTKDLRRVPEIAYAHHEKLNGTGYPRALGAGGIPLQSKMMAIADIYDALTASDRPYKKAVPHALASDILHQEARAGHIDAALLQVFIEAEVPKKALGDL
jgi:HD-GYP domain-containing protein (c-di-GMP phosphodiesterase class II)